MYREPVVGEAELDKIVEQVYAVDSAKNYICTWHSAPWLLYTAEKRSDLLDLGVIKLRSVFNWSVLVSEVGAEPLGRAEEFDAVPFHIGGLQSSSLSI